MLDSSPVALPPIPRPLKRSASTASLPTPPRTHHKRKHSRSRGSYDSDTDLESGVSDDEAGNASHAHKKRRTGEMNEADEEAFWMSTKPKSSSKPVAASKPSPAPLLYRRRVKNADTTVAPVSPPPSNRRTTRAMSIAQAASPSNPLRDSPNNPFLDDPSEKSSPPRSPHTPQQERPTVTYVFRGVRGTFPNPLYDHVANQPLSPSANSRLPIEHPDYSPTMHCPPKLLFPSARRRTLRSARRSLDKGRDRRRSVSVGGSDSEDAEGSPIVPVKLDFKEGEQKQKTWQEELEAL